jgi:GT2 family glycosyltransferase
MTMHKCTIIIPVFDQAVLTRQCLEQVLTEKAQVVVVDDGSTDSTADMLQGFRERILVVRHAQNLGFASSCNDGARLGSGEFLLFLNNDTIPCKGWLDALIGYAEAHPEAAVVGSKLVYPDGAIQHAGVVICQDKYPRHIYTGFPKEHPAVNKSRAFQIVTAACVLIRRDVFKTLEGFDSSFRNGFEDVDFCLRVQQLGKEVHYCHESVVEHLESVSPGRFKRDPENVALYRERWLARVE